MKKIILFLLFVIVLGACKKETDPPAETEINCYPKSVTRTVSFSKDILTTNFTYNEQQKITKEEVLSNNILSKTGLYIYNAEGKLVRKDYYANGILNERDNFILDASGKPEKLVHGYIDAAGTFTMHHYREFKYTPEGKIAKITDFTPDGKILSGLSYEHINESFLKSVSFGANGTFVSKNEITFDAGFSPYSATDIYLNGLTHNILTQLVKDSADNITNTISNSISYNPQHFPVKITQTHSDGLILTEEFQY